MSIVVVGTVAFDTIEAPWGRAERVIGGSAHLFLARREPLHAGEARRRRRAPISSPSTARFSRSEASISRGSSSRAAGKTFFWAGRYGEDPNERETLCTELNVFERVQAGAPAVLPLEPLALPRKHRSRYPDERARSGRGAAVRRLRHDELLDRAQARIARAAAPAHRHPLRERRGGAAALGPEEPRARGARYPRDGAAGARHQEGRARGVSLHEGVPLLRARLSAAARCSIRRAPATASREASWDTSRAPRRSTSATFAAR